MEANHEKSRAVCDGAENKNTKKPHRIGKLSHRTDLLELVEEA